MLAAVRTRAARARQVLPVCSTTSRRRASMRSARATITISSRRNAISRRPAASALPGLLACRSSGSSAPCGPTKRNAARSRSYRTPSSEAADLLNSDCPTYRALTPVVRLEAMEQRLDAMLRAVETVQPALREVLQLAQRRAEGALQPPSTGSALTQRLSSRPAKSARERGRKAASSLGVQMTDRASLLRGDAHFGRGRAHVGIDVLSRTSTKFFWNMPHELARGLVERGFVLPGLHRIEQVRLDARHRGRHREAEIRIGAEAGVLAASRRARR